VKVATLLWGAAFATAGTLVALGSVPGSAAWQTGPRLGIAMVLILLGFFLLAGPWVTYAVRRASSKDTPGGCPVGATCECGHFNFKPRQHCRQCGAATLYPA